MFSYLSKMLTKGFKIFFIVNGKSYGIRNCTRRSPNMALLIVCSLDEGEMLL